MLWHFFGTCANYSRRVAQRLAQKGLDRGHLLVEYRYTQPTDRYPALAAELTALSPDLVVASGPQAAVALKSATATIPIVFVAVFDPVALGLVQSMSRPGGNLTGLATYAPGDFLAKRIEIFRELIPSTRNHN
jgi:putative ABC transport system substrate-binding protein